MKEALAIGRVKLRHSAELKRRSKRTYPVILRERVKDVVGNGLGCDDLIVAQGVAMVHDNHYVLPLGLHRGHKDIPETRIKEIRTMKNPRGLKSRVSVQCPL